MPRDGRVRAVLFDYGLTLVTFDFPRACLMETLEAFRPEIASATGAAAPSTEQLLAGVLLPLEDMLATLGEDEVDYLAVYREAWLRAGLELPAELLYRILDAEQRCWDAAVTVNAEGPGALRELRERGLRTGICSNAPFPPEMMHRQIAGNGLGTLVDAAVFSSEVGRRKPAPELFQAALRRLGVEAGETLYVGDRLLEDYEGARRAGLRALLYANAAPDGVPHITSLRELVACL